MSRPSEATPLLKSSNSSYAGADDRGALPSTSTSAKSSWFPPIARVLFTTLLLSISFSFTQTSLIYSYRVMTCDDYYSTHHVDHELILTLATGDRCALHRIEADTASSVTIMTSAMTAGTIVNLFVTGWCIRTYGVKAAMFQQTIWAAMRNLFQIYALHVGGRTGINIINTSQLFNILGSGGGFQLAANAFIAALATPEKRTSLFGVLGGFTMLGSSAGFSIGGITDYYFGIVAPFKVTFCLLVSSTICGYIILPYLPPDHHPSHPSPPSPAALAEKKKKTVLTPLKIFIPYKKVDSSGRSRRDWNVFLLGAGAFFSVLATSYVPMGLQLVATNVFGFKPAKSGLMLSLTLLVKAFFLSVCFPLIIHYGRHWSSKSSPSAPHDHLASIRQESAVEERPDSPLQAEEPGPTSEPHQDAPRSAVDKAHGSTFDLYFLRWSIFFDGVLTACVSMASKGTHMYIAAGVLPFASGTGAACKGVLLDFVDAEQRADALGAIALIEKLAAVSAIGLFGALFATLSELGQPTSLFLINAAVASVGFLFLMFVQLPKERQIALV